MVQQLVGDTNAEWQDMSPFVVHFTKSSPNMTEYENSMAILYQRELKAQNRFGIGKDCHESPRSVCFSEAPLHQLNRLADKRGSYGIGFSKEYVVARGGGPILYAYKDTPHAIMFKKLVADGMGNKNAPVWQIAPFVDQPGQYGKSSYFFEWEREWRHLGNLAFDQADPAFLIIPEDFHEMARTFFKDAKKDNLGPSYDCPFIDPYWSSEKIKGSLGA